MITFCQPPPTLYPYADSLFPTDAETLTHANITTPQATDDAALRERLLAEVRARGGVHLQHLIQRKARGCEQHARALVDALCAEGVLRLERRSTRTGEHHERLREATWAFMADAAPRLHGAAVKRHVIPPGLTPQEKILYVLRASTGPRSKLQVGRDSGVKQSDCTAIINKLVAAGVVVQETPRHEDGRRKHVMVQLVTP